MNTTAVVLAGGASTRIAPLVTSKPLFRFAGKPMICYILDMLVDVGFAKDVVIVTNPGDISELKSVIRPNKGYKTVVQQKPGGMADALLSAQQVIKDGSIFIVNASDLIEGELLKVALQKQKAGDRSFIVAKKHHEYFDGGYLKFEKGKLTDIVEKPGEGNQPSDLVNLVFHYLKDGKEFMNLLNKSSSKKDDVYEVALSELVKKDEVDVVEYSGSWQSLKYPWHILEMMDKILKTKIVPGNQATFISDSAEIDENVRLEPGVKVLEHAVIKGPSVVGKNTVIGTNALVIDSMVEENCVVGFSSEVCRSYLGSGIWLHHNYIGDSVLEGSNYCGSGASTANFRFDEKTIRCLVKEKIVDSKRIKLGAIIAREARLGVNVSLMPGVKVGTRSFVGPGVVLTKDLLPNSIVTIDQNLRVKPLT